MTALPDIERYTGAGVLVATRISGLFIFGPVFNSATIAPRVKASFVIATTLLLTPVVASEGTAGGLGVVSVAGELAVGLALGVSLMILTEALQMAGSLLGMSFSFSLVNLLDPNTRVETSLISHLLGLFGPLIIFSAGLDRVLLSAVMSSFRTVPAGTAALSIVSAVRLVHAAGGIFSAGLQLATPVMSAALVAEVTIAMMARLAPMLPTQVLGVPLKTLTSYCVLAAGLGVWPGWIETHFLALLHSAGSLIRTH